MTRRPLVPGLNETWAPQQLTLDAVHCPFAGGPCTASPDTEGRPTCPDVQHRVCVNGLPGEDE